MSDPVLPPPPPDAPYSRGGAPGLGVVWLVLAAIVVVVVAVCALVICFK